MKVSEIVKVCLNKIDKENIIGKETRTEDEQKLVDRLVFNINVVCREIATNYFPLIEKKEIDIEDGKYVFANLKGVRLLYPTVLEIDGKTVSFELYATKLKCPYKTGYQQYNGKAVLTYAYLPSSDYALNDEIEDKRINEEVLSDGAVSEYYFQNGIYDKARIFDVAYRHGLNVLKYCAKGV